MRLWHKDLLSVLPREQLVAQWRECSAIAGSILKNNTPNHILVNKILDYPIEHFILYSLQVRQEMTRRGYRTMQSVEDKIWKLLPENKEKIISLDIYDLYKDWHNERYLLQCYYNLQEKYDCGGFSKEIFEKIFQRVYS